MDPVALGITVAHISCVVPNTLLSMIIQVILQRTNLLLTHTVVSPGPCILTVSAKEATSLKIKCVYGMSGSTPLCGVEWADRRAVPPLFSGV